MKIAKLVKYQLNIYFKGAGFVMPFISVAVFLYAIYSVKPVDVISGFLVTGVFLFFIMAWVGVSAAHQEDEVMEQILILKMNSAAAYYIGKLLFLAMIAFIFTLFCILVPVLQNLVNNGTLFNRKLIMDDIISSLLMISSSAICGAFLGNLYHPRVVENKQSAYAALVLVCVLVLAKPVITKEIPALQYLLWPLPSIMGPNKIFADAEYFDIFQSVKFFMIFILYGGIYGTLKSILCHKHRF